jgi:hypothetical protein
MARRWELPRDDFVHVKEITAVRSILPLPLLDAREVLVPKKRKDNSGQSISVRLRDRPSIMTAIVL